MLTLTIGPERVVFIEACLSFNILREPLSFRPVGFFASSGDEVDSVVCVVVSVQSTPSHGNG